MGSGCSSSGPGPNYLVIFRQIDLRLGSDFPAGLKTAKNVTLQLKVVDGIAGDHRQKTEAGFHTHRIKKREQGRFAASLASSSERFSEHIYGSTNSASEVDAMQSTPALASMRADALSSPLIFENSNAFPLMGGRHRLVLEDIFRLK